MPKMRKLLFKDEDLGPVLSKKYGVLERIFPNIIKTLEKNDLEFFLTDEAGSFPGGLYKKLSNWAVCSFMPSERRAKIVISDRAVDSLSNLAFEGLVYHETTRMLLFNEATKNSRLSLRKIEKMPCIEQDVRVYISVERFFKTQGLVPYKIETGNTEYKDEKLHIKYWQEYLAKLREFAPEDVTKIIEQLEFKNEL